MNYKILFRKEYLLLYLIILVGAILRLEGVFTNSFAFTYDVGRDMLALWNIVVGHKIPLIGATTGLPGVFYGPWWYFMLTPFFVLSWGNPQGIALAMALFGILTIFAGYYFGNKLGGGILGLVTAGIISVSPVMVSLSSQIWNPNIAPLFIFIVLLILDKIFNQNNRKILSFFLLGFFLALIIDLEIVFGLLLSTGIILSLLVILNKKINLREILVFILGGLVIFSPRILFDLRHGFLMSKAFFAFFTKGGASVNESLINLFFTKVNVMFDQFNSTVGGGNMYLGVLILIFIVSALVYFYGKMTNTLKNFVKTSVIVILTFIFGTMLFSHDIWPHYLVGIPVFYILLLSFAFYLSLKNLSNTFITLALLVLVLIINFNPISVWESFTKPLWVGDASVYRNQLEVIDYVYKNSNGKQFKYVVYTPPLYDYTYQYLFTWYGPKKYGYPASVKSHLAYFILEPDLQYPSRLTNWLKERKGDGTIIKSETLKSGIIIQTRTN